MHGYFSRAPCTQLNITRGSGKMQCFGKLSQVLTNLSRGLSQSSYSKAFCERSTVLLLLQRTLHMTFCWQKFIRNATFKFSFSKNWQNVSVRLSQSTCFKALYKRSHEQLPSQSTLYITLHELKIWQKYNAQEFCSVY